MQTNITWVFKLRWKYENKSQGHKDNKRISMGYIWYNYYKI